MKNYSEMAESVLKRRDEYLIKKRKRLKKAAAAVSCFCLCVLLGAAIWQSGMPFTDQPSNTADIGNSNNGGSALLDNSSAAAAPVMPNDADPDTGISGSPNETAADTAPAPTASPIDSMSGSESAVSVGDGFFMPFIILTQEEVYEKTGALLPIEAPDGFAFENAGFSDNGYVVLWTDGMDELSWRIRDHAEADDEFITSVAQTENYDLSLYPPPRSASVPYKLRQIVNHPIFRAEELTQEAVNARAYKPNEAGDSNGYRMEFSVLYGDKIVSITSKGVSPEWLFTQLSALQ